MILLLAYISNTPHTHTRMILHSSGTQLVITTQTNNTHLQYAKHLFSLIPFLHIQQQRMVTILPTHSRMVIMIRAGIYRHMRVRHMAPRAHHNVIYLESPIKHFSQSHQSIRCQHITVTDRSGHNAKENRVKRRNWTHVM